MGTGILNDNDLDVVLNKVKHNGRLNKNLHQRKRNNP